MICSLDKDYGCGQLDVGVVTLLVGGQLIQERPCLDHLNDMMDWIKYGEGEAAGLTSWRAEIMYLNEARAQLWDRLVRTIALRCRGVLVTAGTRHERVYPLDVMMATPVEYVSLPGGGFFAIDFTRCRYSVDLDEDFKIIPPETDTYASKRYAFSME